MQEVCQLQKKQQKGEKKKRGSLTENKRRGIMIKNIVSLFIMSLCGPVVIL